MLVQAYFRAKDSGGCVNVRHIDEDTRSNFVTIESFFIVIQSIQRSASRPTGMTVEGCVRYKIHRPFIEIFYLLLETPIEIGGMKCTYSSYRECVSATSWMPHP